MNSSEQVILVCNNGKCGWVGWATETVHPKHNPTQLLCPECHETTEQMTPKWVRDLMRQPQVTEKREMRTVIVPDFTIDLGD